MPDLVPETDQELIMGLNEFEQAVKLQHEKKYTESQQYLKEALTILKNAQQERTLGYIYILKRLAYICFLDQRYSDSEKYFMVAAQMIPSITQNPSNIYNAQKNVLLLLTYTNLDQAQIYSDRMMKDMDEYLPVHKKDLQFMIGNIHLLKGEYQLAKNLYRNTLKMAPKPETEAMILNNLAFASWMHSVEMQKKDTVPKET